ncbi:MAG: NYN domain-containing protein [Candidatus Andersenbacteria bacterium]|nr:NYN domain-containing protein [Candidatus Andersenbacteria bacterium]
MSVPGQFPQQRVGVFVDIQNMYYSARALFGKKVSFKNVLDSAVSDRHLVRALAYGITTEEAHEGEFHAALATQGFEVKTKPLQTFVGGQKKGDWDVGIAMDVLQLEPKIDVAVLVSGDGDFIPLVQFAKGKGLRFEVIGFRESTSSALITAADNFTDLSQDPRRFLIAGNGKSRPRASRSARTPKIIR